MRGQVGEGYRLATRADIGRKDVEVNDFITDVTSWSSPVKLLAIGKDKRRFRVSFFDGENVCSLRLMYARVKSES